MKGAFKFPRIVSSLVRDSPCPVRAISRAAGGNARAHGIPPLPLRCRICAHAAHGFDLPTPAEHQWQKMEPTPRDQLGIANLLTCQERCSQLLSGLLELARQEEAVPQHKACRADQVGIAG